MMKVLPKLLCGFLCLVTSLSYSMPSLSTRFVDRSSKWLLNVHVGEQWSSNKTWAAVDNGTHLAPPYNSDTYTASSSNGSVLLGAQFGRRWIIDNPYVTALSLSAFYQYFDSAPITGEVIQFSVPSLYTNYSYQWSITSNILLAHAKLNLMNYKKVSPYINGGLGGVLNSSVYSETAYPGITPRTSPNFTGSQYQFAYLVGVGIDYNYKPERLIFSAGYQYSSLGSLSGRGSETWDTQKLYLGPYQSNGFTIGVTCLFDVYNSDLYKI